MAVVQYNKIETKWAGYPAIIFRWTNMAFQDTGAPARIPAHSDVTAQVRGNFGGASTILMEGTLDDSLAPVNASYGSCHLVDLTAASVSVSGGLIQILEHPLQIRPNVVGGDGGTLVTVDIIVVKQWKE